MRKLKPVFPLLLTLAFAGSAGAHVTGPSGALPDSALGDTVMMTLANSATLASRKIDISVADGTVTLSGAVASNADRDRAVRLTRRVPGVQDVQDRLTVVSDLPKAPRVDDEALARNVAKKLGEAFAGARLEEEWLFGWELDSDAGWQINIDADDGRITLSGTVDKAGDIRRAVEHTQQVAGVRGIDVALDVADGLSAHAMPYHGSMRYAGWPRHAGPGGLPRSGYGYHGYRHAGMGPLPEVSHLNAASAVAVLSPTADNDAHGVVRFRQTGDGVRVDARVRGLPPGEHAYHVHLYGDCTAQDGTSAGTHFNFIGSSKNPPEDIDRITGNLGDLDAGENGQAHHSAHIELASLTGPYSIVGHAVVVHAKPNDPSSPPIGAAGSRLACGVIGFDAQES